MPPRLIYCADGNRRFAEIAIQHGFAYGAQLPNTIYYQPQFVDQNWRNPVRDKYMASLAQYKPELATVLDLEREEQFDEVVSWAHEAAEHVTESVIIIPKVFSAIQKLPREINGKPVRLGYSVPTRFAGTEVPIWEFSGWPVHLLGGSPQEQMKLAKYMNVSSADGNYAHKMALRWNQFFAPGSARYARNRFWPQLCEAKNGGIHHDAPYYAFTLSCINIQAAWRGCPAMIRYAEETDLPGIKQIANQYKNELGFVMLPSLRESINRQTLLVAEVNRQVVGFVNARLRRDGRTTIYEIAVHRNWRRNHIGASLLRAFPGAVRLKCTLDNPANEFYQHEGFELAGVDPGKKRPLNIWERRI